MDGIGVAWVVGIGAAWIEDDLPAEFKADEEGPAWVETGSSKVTLLPLRLRSWLG